MRSMPVDWSFGPVPVAIENVWHTVVVRAYRPAVEHVVDPVYANVLQLEPMVMVSSINNDDSLILVSRVPKCLS